MWAEGVVAAIGAKEDGVVRVQRAEAAGVGPNQLQTLRRRGVLISAGRGVDRLRDHPRTWRQDLRIALARAGPGAVVARRSAARLHGFYAYRGTTTIEVVVVRGSDHRDGTATVAQTRRLRTAHVTEVDGIPCTTAARTFFDLCGDPDGGLPVSHPAHRRRMEQVYNDALARRGLSFVLEAAVLVDMARRGRAGTQLVRSLLLQYGPDFRPTQSDLETACLQAIDAHGIPRPQLQVTLSDDEGFIGIVDFLWPSAMLVLEVDSSWHDGPLDRALDAARDRRLRRSGYRVLRARYGDIVVAPGPLMRKLGAAVGVYAV